MARTKLEEFFESLETGEQVVEEKPQEEQPVSEPSTDLQQPPTTSQQTTQEEQKQLVGGKFKSVDDLLHSYQELERKLYEVQEKLKRAEQGLEAFYKAQQTQQPVQSVPVMTPEAFDVDFEVDPLVDPKGFAKKIYEKVTNSVLQQVQNQIMLQRQMEEVRERFYKLNPDLVGKERLVGMIAQDVAREMPNASIDVVLDEIAKRTRQFLHSLTAQQKVQQATTPISPTPQQNAVREKIQQTQTITLTPEQEVEAYIKQRKEFLAKKKL